jgi:hypothetical protein
MASLWTCPACGAKLVARNGSHSCVRRSVEEFFADKPPVGVAFARAFIAAVEAVGPIKLHPVKTRIALMVDVRFAAINRIGATGIRGHFWLRESHASPRFARIEKLGATDSLYHFGIDAEHPIDRALRAFIKRAYANGVRRPATPRPRRRRGGSLPT